MKRVSRCRIVMICAVVLWIQAASAWAQEEPALEGGLTLEIATEGADLKPWSRGVPIEAREIARDIFYQGNKLADGRFLATAEARYQEALAIWPHPAFYYNLFVVQLGLKQTVQAYENLREAMRHGAEPLGDDKYEEGRRHLEFLRSEIVHVEIVCDEPGAEVTLDGKRLFVGPGRHRAIMVPGGHQLAARKEGRLPDIRQIVLPAGQEVRYELVLRYWVTTRRYERWVPWAAVGAGAALTLAGGVFHWQSASRFREFDEALSAHCMQPGGGCATTPELDDRLRGAERYRGFSRAGYIAGGVVAAAGVALMYLNREQRELRDTRQSSAGISLVPVIAPDAWVLGAELHY